MSGKNDEEIQKDMLNHSQMSDQQFEDMLVSVVKMMANSYNDILDEVVFPRCQGITGSTVTRILSSFTATIINAYSMATTDVDLSNKLKKGMSESTARSIINIVNHYANDKISNDDLR